MKLKLIFKKIATYLLILSMYASGLTLFVASPAYAAPLLGCQYNDLSFDDFYLPSSSYPTSGNILPLTDLGTGTYLGKQGGLYPGGSNIRSAGHQALGLQAAANVTARDASGNPSSSGKIGLVSLGMSNTSTEFDNGGNNWVLNGTPVSELTFTQKALNPTYLPNRNPALVIVNGAQGGQVSQIWAKPGYSDEHGSYSAAWAEFDNRISAAGLTPDQVQVAWVKNTERNPGAIAGGVFPDWITGGVLGVNLQVDLEAIARELTTRLPNLQIIYFSSRTRSYRMHNNDGASALNPEPFAYESAFGVKWLVEKYINDPSVFEVSGHAPFVDWGPYLWIDGTAGRSDGMTWVCTSGNDATSDVRTDDYTHPGGSGIDKVSQMLMNFFKTDPTTCSWFTTGASCGSLPPPPPPGSSPTPAASRSPSPSASVSTSPRPSGSSSPKASSSPRASTSFPVSSGNQVNLSTNQGVKVTCDQGHLQLTKLSDLSVKFSCLANTIQSSGFDYVRGATTQSEDTSQNSNPVVDVFNQIINFLNNKN